LKFAIGRLAPSPGERLRAWSWGVASAAPAFVAYANFILNHFYRYGAVLLDTGLLAALAWHASPGLPMRPVFDGMSFYAIHIAPIFTLLSALSWLFPLSMAQWFALFTGIAQALLAVAVFWLLWSEYDLRRGWRAAIAVMLAVLFSFNGLAIAQVRYPHFEVLLAATLILFLAAWRRRRWGLAAIFFALCLICREDAGFHVFAVLSVVIVLNRWNGVAWSAQKPAFVFLTLGFVYSLSALIVGHLLFPQQSNLVRVYLGSPPFAHVNAHMLTTRVLGVMVWRAYIVLPALCAAIWAIAARNPFIVAGYLAFIPWAALNLLAKSDIAGTLSSYYAFPFLAAMFWPLIGWRIKAPPPNMPAWTPYGGFGAMILTSFVALSAQHDPSRIPLWPGFTDPPAAAEQASVDRAVDAIQADHARMGCALASDGVVSLRPETFRRDEVFLDAPSGARDTVLYFPGDRNAGEAAAAAAASGLRRTYAIAGTPLRIATDVRPADLPALGPLLRRAGSTPPPATLRKG
jgi:hypothetical protein